MVSPEQNIERGDAYSPVQVRKGIVQPSEDAFPAHDIRVSQHNYPLPLTVKELRPMRATVQSSDICQLRCPGCYVAEWVDPEGDVRKSHQRTIAGNETVSGQIKALGELQDVFLLGVEPTLTPDTLQEMLAVSREMGATVMSITNGASPLKRYEETFRSGLEQEEIHKINLSLDSIDPAIHNRLRGRPWAYERTMDTIRHALEKDDPIKINITVWPDNYHTILETVDELYQMGVKGFAFHAGSMEGVRKDARLAHIEPAAWRALSAKLIEFRDAHPDLENFTLPFIFFSKQELDEGIIGKPDSVALYEEHLAKIEGGESQPAPVRVCPAFDIPQVYVFSNDSNDGTTNEGAISLCNIHTVGANKKHNGAYFANYDPTTQQFVVEQDAAHNELEIMRQSPYLCPAREYAMGDNPTSDRFETEAGDLYHGCRYVSANQFPQADQQLGRELYEGYRQMYRQWSELMGDTNILVTDLTESLRHTKTVRDKQLALNALRQRISAKVPLTITPSFASTSHKTGSVMQQYCK